MHLPSNSLKGYAISAAIEFSKQPLQSKCNCSTIVKEQSIFKIHARPRPRAKKDLLSLETSSVLYFNLIACNVLGFGRL